MKKILIVCNFFAPENRIATIRITKFAKYFRQYGYDVTVIAEPNQGTIEDKILKQDAEGIKVFHINNSMKIKNLISFYHKAIAPIKSKKYDNLDDRMRMNRKTGKYEFYVFEKAHPLIGSLDYLVELVRQYDLFKNAKKYLNECENIDFIFTTYGQLFGILAGAYFHRKNRKIPWIVDLRDAICHYLVTPQYMRWFALLVEHYIWRKADCIIGASKGLCRRVTRKYRGKVYCVTNGYDQKDREGICIDNKTHDKLKFAYTGGMYGGLQNLSPVFNSIRVLIDDGNINDDKIEFCFAGKESAFKVFKSQAQKYALDKNCIYYGRIERKESLKLQMESDILLVAVTEYQANPLGMITGKVLEYMSANKPIIAIVNGDIEHSELGEIIHSANLGIVYEEAHCKKDGIILYNYLLEKYKEFTEKGELVYNPNEQILRKYDYRYLSKKVLRIIESLQFCEKNL